MAKMLVKFAKKGEKISPMGGLVFEAPNHEKAVNMAKKKFFPVGKVPKHTLSREFGEVRAEFDDGEYYAIVSYF